MLWGKEAVSDLEYPKAVLLIKGEEKKKNWCDNVSLLRKRWLEGWSKAVFFFTRREIKQQGVNMVQYGRRLQQRSTSLKVQYIFPVMLKSDFLLDWLSSKLQYSTHIEWIFRVSTVSYERVLENWERILFGIETLQFFLLYNYGVMLKGFPCIF